MVWMIFNFVDEEAITFGLFLLPRTPEATEKCPLHWDERLSCSRHLSHSPLRNVITLHYEQPVKPSFSRPRTDCESGIQEHNPKVHYKRQEDTGFFSKTDHSTQRSYLPSGEPHTSWARESRAKGRLPSTGPDSPLLLGSFSLQKFLQSYENICVCQDSRKMLLPVRGRNYTAL